MTQTTDRTEGAHPVDYERLRYAMGMVPNLGKCNAEVRGWALDTFCPVPGKGPVRLGEMTRDDHKMVATYLKAHDSMYPGEHRAGGRAGYRTQYRPFTPRQQPILPSHKRSSAGTVRHPALRGISPARSGSPSRTTRISINLL